MAMTLLESSKLASQAGEAMRSGIIELYAGSSAILGVILIEDAPGGTHRYIVEGELPGVGFRGINEAFSEGLGILNPQVESVVYLGGDVDVDRESVLSRGPAQRTVHEAMKIKSLGRFFDLKFIKGDASSDGREMDGLQRRITGTQLIDAGATSGGNALSLLKLDAAIDQVENPTHLIMSKGMRRRFSEAQRTTAVAGNIQLTQDAFGRQVMQYGTLPILELDVDNAYAQILPFTEPSPVGAVAATTSIYVVSFSEMGVIGFQGHGIDTRDMGELQEKPVLRTRIDWSAGIAVQGGRAAARIRGITDAALVA